MSSVVISGNTSGTITLAAPDVAGTTTLTLPAVSGTLITSGGGYAGSFTTLTSTQDATLATSSGNVGIGTATPSYKLQVYGASNPEMRLGDAVVTYQLYTEGATAAVMGTVGSHALVLRTNATERLRIGTSGELGLSGANYGTSGQVLTSNGSGAAASWTTISAGAMTLLGTVAATGNSVSLTGLNLSSYTSLFIIANAVSCASAFYNYVSASNSATSVPWLYVNGGPTYVSAWISLYGGGVSGASDGVGSGLSTSSTAIYFRMGGGQSYNGSGNFRVYGVK